MSCVNFSTDHMNKNANTWHEEGVLYDANNLLGMVCKQITNRRFVSTLPIRAYHKPRYQRNVAMLLEKYKRRVLSYSYYGQFEEALLPVHVLLYRK